MLYRRGVHRGRGAVLRSPRQLSAVTAVLVLVLGLRSYVSLRGYLYADDFAFRYWASIQGPDLDYLTRSYGGHVNPIGMFNQWVLQALFPGSHTALAVFTLILWAATLVIAACVAVLLTHRWQAAALLVAVVGVSLVGFENTTWWAAALYAGPYQLFLVGGLYCIVRFELVGGDRWRWLAVACAGGAAFSFSRGFMAAMLMFLVAACVPFEETGPRGLRKTWRAGVWAWVSMVGLCALSLTMVIASSAHIPRAGFTFTGIPRYMATLLTQNVLPAIWGGPWRWFELPPPAWEPIVTNPAPAVWAAWLFALATALACVWLWRRRPHLRHLLLACAGFTAVVLLVAAVARSGTAVESTAYRYTFDVVWLVALLMTLAVVPMWWQQTRISLIGAAVVVIVCVSALISGVIPARDWMGNQARQYMGNASSTFSQIPKGQFVLDQGVPDDLIHPALMAPFANARTVMTPVPGAPIFGPYAEGTLFGFASDGHVEQQDVTGPTSLPGPDTDCGYRVTSDVRTVPLDGQLISWDFYARVAYFSGTDTTLNLAVGGQIHTVPLRAGGLTAVYFPVSGPGEEVLVSVGSPGVAICVTEIRIGNRVSSGTGERVPLPVTKLAQ